MVTVLWSAAHLTHYSFLNPSEKTTSLRNTLSESMRYTQNYKTAASIGQQKGPSSSQPCPTTTSWAIKFYLINHIHLTSPRPNTTSSSISTTFCRGNGSTAAGHRNAFQESVETQSIDFYATGINKLISCWQERVDCNGSYFD